MKIIKIVVDELPKCCFDCDAYWFYDGQNMCDILKIDLNHEVNLLRSPMCVLDSRRNDSAIKREP